MLDCLIQYTPVCYNKSRHAEGGFNKENKQMVQVASEGGWQSGTSIARIWGRTRLPDLKMMKALITW